MPYAPGIQDISGQLTAQGISQAANAYAQKIGAVSNAVTGFMQSYKQNQLMTRQALGKFEGAMRADPEFQKYIEAASSEEGGPNLQPEIKKAILSLKSGKTDMYDAAVLSSLTDTFTATKRNQAQQALVAAQAARMAQETDFAAADRARQERALLTMQNLGQGVGTGVYRGDVQQRMAANPFMQVQRQAMEAGGTPLTGNQLIQAVAAQQSGGPQLTERERATKTLRDAFVARVGRAPDAQEEADLLRQSARLGAAPYREGIPYADKNGQFIGTSVFNTEAGTNELVDTEGNRKPIPTGAKPVTATAMSRDMMATAEFRKLKNDVTQDELALKKYSNYLSAQKDTETGVKRIADKFSSGFKTFFGTGKLNKSEFAQAYANQQLQGLLGATRLSVVGGGVMTEQDALRVIQRLGGDVDALQNPELVERAISDMYADKYRAYDDNIKFYNMAVDSFYGNKGFERAEPVKFNPAMLQSSAAVVDDAAAKRQSRLEELRRKKAGQ